VQAQFTYGTPGGTIGATPYTGPPVAGGATPYTGPPVGQPVGATPYVAPAGKDYNASKPAV
jgi:hypothetical protein